jgi:long-chain fatty acid transport protein
MSYRSVRSFALACTGVGFLLTITSHANAGGFALREQSAWGQGASYAGVAAGGSLSAMFWNPATMTQMPGLQSESVLSLVTANSTNTVGAGSTLAALGYGGTGNIANTSLVPSSYYSWQINPQTWLGLSINAPFGLSESFPDVWAGRDYGAGGSHLSTYNATPSFAYAINNWISIGAGIQIQYADATLTKGIGAGPTVEASIDGAGWGFGFTAGLTLTPTPGTTIGLGYRSGINQKINGTLLLPLGPGFNPPFSTPGSVNTTINLPDVVSLGLRQKLSSQWTALATVEWSNWSRIGTSAVLQPNGAPALVLAGLGGGAVTIPFEYKDGWFYSVGAEYQWNERLALRAGVGYEKSPITDQVRIPVLADDDRAWVSAGATYKYSDKLSFDFAYSHLFVKNTPINVVAGNPSFNGAVAYVGTVDTQIDIVSVAMKYRWDDPPAPAKSKMITK